MPDDEKLMPFISSANIACGYHAGDHDLIKRTIELCLTYNVAIGAHPGFADKQNFGREELQLSAEAYYDLIAEQLFIIQKIATDFGAILHHIKPHGALYNMAAKNAQLAGIIASAVKDADPHLIVYGLSGSAAITAANALNLATANEVFADRTYQPDGSLTPRSQPHALIEDDEKALVQVLQMINRGTVTTVDQQTVAIKADTVCLHGDGAHALSFAKLISQNLKQNNIAIQTIHH